MHKSQTSMFVSNWSSYLYDSLLLNLIIIVIKAVINDFEGFLKKNLMWWLCINSIGIIKSNWPKDRKNGLKSLNNQRQSNDFDVYIWIYFLKNKSYNNIIEFLLALTMTYQREVFFLFVLFYYYLCFSFYLIYIIKAYFDAK